MLISLGYKTTSSCQGHENEPFITLDKKTTNIYIVQYFNKFFVSCEIEKDSIIIKGNRNFKKYAITAIDIFFTVVFV